MPSLDGATEWLNSEPLGPAGLRGHVVLVNFWTLTCINWLRQEPYVRAWSQAYRDDGLIAIGVHTPEFSFEHDVDLVRQATEERAIDYPVVVVPVQGVGVEAEADWDHLRTPETYLGSWRRERSRQWVLTGEWTTTDEHVVLDRAGGTIAMRFHARDAHLVLSPGARDPIPFRLLLDGEAPGPSHGVDVDEDGNGVLSDGRMYQLVREHDKVRDRTLEITFLEPGAEAYAFTFG
jgi:thiol-disulfide isomerase/thioredoxin